MPSGATTPVAAPVSGSSLRRGRHSTPTLPSVDTFSLNRPPSTPRRGNADDPSQTSGTPRRRDHEPQSFTSASRFPPPGTPKQTPPSTPFTASAPASEWRSSLLSLEVRLRELAADGSSEPPSAPRIEEVLRLFDAFMHMVPPTFVETLRLFRLEFCRAIFSGVSGTGLKVTGGGGGVDAAQVPFFEKIDKMLRERNILQVELETLETDHNVADLKRQIAKLGSLIPFYEQEVGRLTRENERQQDEVARLRQDGDLTQSAHDRAFRTLEDETRRLSSENRELQLQVFRLSKDNREQLSGQSMYQHMKQQKTDRLHEMFSKGNEDAGLQLMCHQLEHSLNGVMTEFDIDFTKAIPNEMPSLRVKLNRKVALILEELHFCESRLEYLQNPQQNGFFSVLRASTLYELEVTKLSSEAGTGGKGALQHRHRSGSSHAKPAMVPTPRGGTHDVHDTTGGAAIDVQAKRLEWVKNLLGSVVEARDLTRTTSTTASSTTGPAAGGEAGRGPRPAGALAGKFPFHTTEPGHFLQELFTCPMLDVSSNKFMVGIDVHAYMAGTSTHVRTLHHMDPTTAIDLPPRTTHVKLKFLNPMLRPATLNVPAEDAAQVQQAVVSTAFEWSPSQPGGGKTTHPLQTSMRGGGGGGGGNNQPPPPQQQVSVGNEPVHWRLYRKLFRSYRPYFPRALDAHHLDFLMYQVCERHGTRMALRYEACRTAASQRSTNTQMTKVMAERLFRDEYQPTEFQISLVETLEARYSFPELVGKSLYEVLTSLEALGSTAPQTQLYLDCIGGVVSYSSTYLTSAILHAVASFWPTNLTLPDQEVPQRDVAAVLRYLYPTESAIRVDVDHIMNDLLLSCQEQITLRATRSFLVHSIAQCDEGFVKKLKELFSYRAEVVQWTELEFSDLFDTLRTFVGDEGAAQTVHLFQESCCIHQKASRLPLVELSYIAASTVLSHALKSKRM